MVVSNVTNQTWTTLLLTVSPNVADCRGYFRSFTCLGKKKRKTAAAKDAKNLLRPDKPRNDSLKYKHFFISGQASASCTPVFALSVVASPLSVISSRIMSFECLNNARPLFLLLLFLIAASLYLSRRGNSLSFAPRPLHSNPARRTALHLSRPVAGGKLPRWFTVWY